MSCYYQTQSLLYTDFNDQKALQMVDLFKLFGTGLKPLDGPLAIQYRNTHDSEVNHIAFISLKKVSVHAFCCAYNMLLSVVAGGSAWIDRPFFADDVHLNIAHWKNSVMLEEEKQVTIHADEKWAQQCEMEFQMDVSEWKYFQLQCVVCVDGRDDHR